MYIEYLTEHEGLFM